MKIINEHDNGVSFAALGVGDIFLYEGKAHIKTDHYHFNAVRLDDGKLCSMYDEKDMVVKVDMEAKIR